MQLTAIFSLAELTVTGWKMPNVPNEAEVASLSLLAKMIYSFSVICSDATR